MCSANGFNPINWFRSRIERVPDIRLKFYAETIKKTDVLHGADSTYLGHSCAGKFHLYVSNGQRKILILKMDFGKTVAGLYNCFLIF